jgi:hypothetical protein
MERYERVADRERERVGLVDWYHTGVEPPHGNGRQRASGNVRRILRPFQHVEALKRLDAHARIDEDVINLRRPNDCRLSRQDDGRRQPKETGRSERRSIRASPSLHDKHASPEERFADPLWKPVAIIDQTSPAIVPASSAAQPHVEAGWLPLATTQE